MWRREAGRAPSLYPRVYCVLSRGRHGYPPSCHMSSGLQTLASLYPRTESRCPEARWAGQVGGAGCGVTCVQCGRGVMWPVAWRCWSQAAGGRAQEAAVGGTRPSTTTSLTSTIDQCGAEVRLGRTEQLIHHTVNRQPGRAPVLPLNMPIVNTHSSVSKHGSGSE